MSRLYHTCMELLVIHIFPMTLVFALLHTLLLSLAWAQELDYVGSKVCADCHQELYDSWSTSHHANAWQPPSSKVLKGAFKGEVFSHKGMIVKFQMEGDEHTIRVVEKGGELNIYTVHSVGGIFPLQHLIIETLPGRLQSFDVVWDVEKRRWFHLYPDQDLRIGDGFHWTGPYKNWNSRCAECHSTGYKKNYDFPTRSYSSTQSEMGVGCEACHGPAGAHISLKRGKSLSKNLASLDAEGFAINLSDEKAIMEQCASCHSRREAFGNGSPLPGTKYSDAYNLEYLRPGLYQADGQILDEVYVYGSFKQSKMHENGVTCGDCHQSHGGELRVSGNAVCTQCHSENGNDKFPTLEKVNYDHANHHHHMQGSEGAQCISCHMPARTYMGIDSRRDHSFRIPRPDLFPKTLATDACSDCHNDKSSGWAAASIAEWYPLAASRSSGYIASLSGAHFGRFSTISPNTDWPALVQATLLWLNNSSESISLPKISPYLDSPDPLIRAGVSALISRLPQEEALKAFRAGLRDTNRNVRIARARSWFQYAAQSGLLSSELTRIAYAELYSMYSNQLDFPEAHVQMGGLSLILRDLARANLSFREVVRLDPQNVEAWITLVRIAAVVEGRKAARKTLSEALSFVPDDATLQRFQQEF